jgi:hypothetical protein
MIYKEVFAGAKIVLPAANARCRSRRLHGKLLSLLLVCRQCHLEALPILYSDALLEIGPRVAAETIHQALQKRYFQRVKTLVVNISVLKRTFDGPQQTEFPALTRLAVITGRQPYVYDSSDLDEIHQICRSEDQKFRSSEASSWIDWSLPRGFCIHITFGIWWVNHSRRYEVGASSPRSISDE